MHADTVFAVLSRTGSPTSPRHCPHRLAEWFTGGIRTRQSVLECTHGRLPRKLLPFFKAGASL